MKALLKICLCLILTLSLIQCSGSAEDPLVNPDDPIGGIDGGDPAINPEDPGNDDDDIIIYGDYDDCPLDPGSGLRICPGTESDPDGDGFEGAEDNCPNTFNPDQTDLDVDGVGDACDNCENYNPDQANMDKGMPYGDDLGDACDLDVDGDGIADKLSLMSLTFDGPDTCPMVPNCLGMSDPACNADTDDDGYGDACDDEPDNDLIWKDYDGDGAIDNSDGGLIALIDNCLIEPNPDQADFDEDGLGDVCDDDIDGDDLANEFDDCDFDVTPDCLGGVDVDKDDFDTDTDGDGSVDGADNCPVHENGDQSDIDGDGLGDVCDEDRDGDGWPNKHSDGITPAGVLDNCPDHSNEAQSDPDGDGKGNICDDDRDGDGLCDKEEYCEVIDPNDRLKNYWAFVDPDSSDAVSWYSMSIEYISEMMSAGAGFWYEMTATPAGDGYSYSHPGLVGTYRPANNYKGRDILDSCVVQVGEFAEIGVGPGDKGICISPTTDSDLIDLFTADWD